MEMLRACGEGGRERGRTLRIVFRAFVLTLISTSLSSASLLNVLFCRFGSQNLDTSSHHRTAPHHPYHTTPFQHLAYEQSGRRK